MSSWEEVTFPWRGKVNVQVKMKSALEQAMKIRMGSRDTVLLFLYLGSRWGGWLTPRPGRFTPGKETRYPFVRRLGGLQGRSGRMRKVSPQLEFNLRTIQPVTSCYTYWALPAHLLGQRLHNFRQEVDERVARCAEEENHFYLWIRQVRMHSKLLKRPREM
jgi:hypothetical protein